MRQKKIKLSAVLLLGLGLTGIQAQSTLYVKAYNGTQIPYALSSIRKLTFSSGNIQVNKTSGSTDSYALNDIRYLNFSNLTTNVSQISSEESNNIMLNPNPAIDQLQISYETPKAGNVRVEIVNVQGQVLLQQTLISQNLPAGHAGGTNHAIISVSQLAKGIYICRLQSDHKIEIIKFIKN